MAAGRRNKRSRAYGVNAVKATPDFRQIVFFDQAFGAPDRGVVVCLRTGIDHGRMALLLHDADFTGGQ
jgi:hypothetical protein